MRMGERTLGDIFLVSGFLVKPFRVWESAGDSVPEPEKFEYFLLARFSCPREVSRRMNATKQSRLACVTARDTLIKKRGGCEEGVGGVGRSSHNWCQFTK